MAGRITEAGGEVGAERPSAALSPQEADFVRRVMAGDSLESAYVAASLGHPGAPVEDLLEGSTNLMLEPRVRRYFLLLQRALKARQRVSITPERWASALESIAMVDVGLLMDEQGVTLAPHQLPERIRRAIKEITRRSDGRTTTWTYKFESRLDALELLGRYMGVFQADATNVADVEEQRRTVYWRFIHHMHWGEGLTVAEATEIADSDPARVEAFGRARGLLGVPEAGG